MTFYFYDLETSGFSPKYDRIMQFGGQRTDMDLSPIAEPDNMLIKMTPDVLPSPGAVLVHGITPQKTLADGRTEAEFCEFLTTNVSTPDTIIVGYNNLRFDNEFIRFTLWRNFHDAYEWSWKGGRGSWDLLDVTRMTRALRPDGIKWPFAPDGKPTNSLEYVSAVNKLEHVDAHDAMSDVRASMAVAKLLKQRQPKLFDYLLSIRGKDKVAPLVTKGDPLVYTSGRYSSDFAKSTVAVMVAEKNDKTGALMYDLRIDPGQFKNLSADELAKLWSDRSEEASYFPVKELKYNRCPAIAPTSVLDNDALKRLHLHQEIIGGHLKELQRARDFGEKLLKALDKMWPKRQPEMVVDEQKVDAQLYDGFVKEEDKTRMSLLRAAKPEELSELNVDFKDERLTALLPLYKARNFPQTLDATERKAWEGFRHRKLLGGASNIVDRFLKQLEEIDQTPGLTTEKRQLLADLKLYGQSVIPKDQV